MGKSVYLSAKDNVKTRYKKYNFILISRPVDFISFYCALFWLKDFHPSSGRWLVKYNIIPRQHLPAQS